MPVLQSIPFAPDWEPTTQGIAVLPSPTGGEVTPAPAAATGLPVIIAEDDPVSRALLRSVLEKSGYRVIVTHDGREAMEAIRAQATPALAVLDWMMPGLDGTDICRRVREANKVIYIILLTARAGKEQIVEGLRAGADDYLTKPFDKDELRARLQVGARIIGLYSALNARVQELEAAAGEINKLRLSIPL